MAFPIFTLIACILVLILIVTTVFAIGYYFQRKEAYAYPSPWCFNTWQCGGTGYNPVTAYADVLTQCALGPTGVIDTNQCNCAIWAFYDPQNNNSYTGTPPTTAPPNYCVGATGS